MFCTGWDARLGSKVPWRMSCARPFYLQMVRTACKFSTVAGEFWFKIWHIRAYTYAWISLSWHFAFSVRGTCYLDQ